MPFAVTYTVICVVCKVGAMVARANRTTGQTFYGCSRFPRCRGSMSAAVHANHQRLMSETAAVKVPTAAVKVPTVTTSPKCPECGTLQNYSSDGCFCKREAKRAKLHAEHLLVWFAGTLAGTFLLIQEEIKNRAMRHTAAVAAFAGFLGAIPAAVEAATVTVNRAGDMLCARLASGEVRLVWGMQTDEIATAPEGTYPAPALVKDLLEWGTPAPTLEY
jgi:ssDNA-binding Zn-finger/Zn-ribbon topoisomerase 1